MSLCAATDCSVRRPNYFMCAPHWRLCPLPMRQRWKGALRHCNRHGLNYLSSREFVEASADLVDHVALAEGKPIGSAWREQLGRLNAGENP